MHSFRAIPVRPLFNQRIAELLYTGTKFSTSRTVDVTSNNDVGESGWPLKIGSFGGWTLTGGGCDGGWNEVDEVMVGIGSVVAPVASVVVVAGPSLLLRQRGAMKMGDSAMMD
jgi:hypothetical protein